MKLISALATVALAGLMLAGCSASNVSSMSKENPATDEGDYYDTLGKLENASSIRLEKAMLSFGDSWTVKADGTEVAEISGEEIYLIGDTYSLYTISGNFMGAEAEGYRVMNSSADLYDYVMEPAGAIDQQYSLFFYKFELKNTAGETVGTMDQNFSIGFSADIKNPDGSVAYEIERDFISMGDKVTVTAIEPQQVPVIQAIWMATIANEIYVAAQEKDNN